MSTVDTRPEEVPAGETESPRLPRAREGSLNAVRAVIPESCYRRPNARAAALVGRDAVGWLLTLTALVFVTQWYLVVPLLVLAGLWVSALFVIGHDASHQALFQSRKVNSAVARWAMLPSMHLPDAWDLGHNRLHHGHTVRWGMDFVWHPVTAEQYGAMSRLQRLRHRLEWSCIGSGAYYAREVWFAKMVRFTPPAKWSAPIRRDRQLVAAYAVAAIATAAVIGWFRYGAVGLVWMPLALVIIPFLIFLHVIGWTVYVHHVDPDLKWYDKREWTPFKAQMESTTVLRFPRLVNIWFHHIFVHVPHHVDPRIPCHQLPAAAAAIEAAFPDTVVDEKFRLRRYFHATKTCKLYDLEAGTWVPYAAAKR